VAAVHGAGAEAVAVSIDLLDLDALAAAADRIGATDVLVNNAATVAPLGPSIGLDPAHVLDAFRLNVLVPLVLTGHLLPGMIERDWGRVVNVSSGIVAHPTGMIGGSTNAATKAALETQTLSIAAEYAGTGVTINIYRPGGVDTAMQEWIRNQDPEKIGRELHDRFMANSESGTLLLTPEDSGRALVAHLKSEANAEIWDVTDQL
jgi:Short-chain dehydrogenases of various substrate specificities